MIGGVYSASSAMWDTVAARGAAQPSQRTASRSPGFRTATAVSGANNTASMSPSGRKRAIGAVGPAVSPASRSTRSMRPGDGAMMVRSESALRATSTAAVAARASASSATSAFSRAGSSTSVTRSRISATRASAARTPASAASSRARGATP